MGWHRRGRTYHLDETKSRSAKGVECSADGDGLLEGESEKVVSWRWRALKGILDGVTHGGPFGGA